MEIEYTRSENVHEYLVWDDNFARVIASARLKDASEGIEIEVINVDRSYRGEGVGSLLLNRIISDFSRSTLFAWVFEERVGWYEKYGFRAVDKNSSLVKVAQ